MIKIPRKLKFLFIKVCQRIGPLDLEAIYKMGYSQGRIDAIKEHSKIFNKEFFKKRR